MSASRQRRFTELEGKQLLQLLQINRTAVGVLIDQAPLNSEIYCGLDELWKVTRRLAEIITGDATYFDIPSHTVQTLLKPNMPERTLILRTWE